MEVILSKCPGRPIQLQRTAGLQRVRHDERHGLALRLDDIRIWRKHRRKLRWLFAEGWAVLASAYGMPAQQRLDGAEPTGGYRFR